MITRQQLEIINRKSLQYPLHSAEKIRAMSGRARYRDFYDCFLLLEKYQIDLEEISGFIAQKEIRKPITKANIEANWKVVMTQKEKEMNQIYYSAAVEDVQIEEMIQKLPFTQIISPYQLKKRSE